LTAQGRTLCRISPPSDFAIKIERGDTQPTACCSHGFGEIMPTNRLLLKGVLGPQPATTGIEVVAADTQRHAGAPHHEHYPPSPNRDDDTKRSARAEQPA
jgi:hypothetical protein